MNSVKQDYAMKLGEGGEAFFVFETSENIPEALQTSPLVSPMLGPKTSPEQTQPSIGLQEPEYLDLEAQSHRQTPSDHGKADIEVPFLAAGRRAQSFTGKCNNHMSYHS